MFEKKSLNQAAVFVASALFAGAQFATAAPSLPEREVAVLQPAASRHSENQLAAPEMRVVPGFEEPLIAIGKPGGAREGADLDAAILAFKSPRATNVDFPERAAPFLTFLRKHPHSPWRVAVLTNLGIGYYHSGYFSRALSAWEAAWKAGRTATEPRAKALADRAVGELARMHARVGHRQELEALFAEVGDRPLSGPATEMMAGAREGLWMFINEPGQSYLCGPMAMKNLLHSMSAPESVIEKISDERSGPHGYSLVQVSDLAQRLGVTHRMVYRPAGSDVPVPSIVNWKLSHYAAIVEERDGLYHIKDPTFGSGDAWITKAAIDAESSGYFVVPSVSPSDARWRAVTADESHRVFGMGQTTTNQQGSTTPSDTCGDQGKRMCAVGVAAMLVSLSLNDTPVGYTPRKGPPVEVRLTYNQREAGQPANFSFFNVSPKWTLNFLSWVQDNPAVVGASVLRYVAGGGFIDYSSTYAYSSATGQFTPEKQGQAVLTRIPATGPATSYELRMPDGSKQVFAKSDGATTNPRRMFLTSIVDPAGNALTLNYDAQLRLSSIADASGRLTTFAYEQPGSPLLVTRIADPFGRHADLTYDAVGRLSSITDVIGITSSFEYDAGGLINAMTTPYGTSRFAYGQDTGANSRFLEITDPMGFTERYEFRHTAPGIAYSDPVAPTGMGVGNVYLYYRNTFYWDKHLYPITHTDYTKAQLIHWLHNLLGQTSPIIESTKAPLERRVWRTYPAQGATYYEGLAGRPTAIGRVLDDGTTQSQFFQYNTLGKPVATVDPLSRKIFYTYAANNIDLLTVQQQTSATGVTTTASYTYNAQHLPLTYTDAAGQTTQYAYNAAGQLTSETNPLGEVTRYDYDSIGRLVSVTNAVGAVQASYTYDSADRIATKTDSEGHTIAYQYDNLDRVTRETYPDGTFIARSWDKLDLASITDRAGRVTSYTHDANRSLLSITDPLGRTTRYSYYENGVPKSLTDAKGNITSWDIDGQNRIAAKHYADGTTQTLAYEATTSRLKSSTDALSQTKSYTYFNDDEIKTISYAGAANATSAVTFAYDPYFRRLTSMTDVLGTTSWQYKAPGANGALQLSQEDGPYANDAVTYQYDALGRMVNRTVDSAVEQFGYDSLGRTVSHVTPLGTFALGYLGATSQVQSAQSAAVGRQFSYDTNLNDRRLTSIQNGANGRTFQYAINPPTKQVMSISESLAGVPGQSWSYGYDGADRLRNAQPSTGVLHSYDYDSADNIDSTLNAAGTRDSTFNSVNAVAVSNTIPFVYDANGNLLDDGQRTYKWDAESRLVGVGYKAAPTQSTSFKYDGLGRRLAIINTTGATSSETRYLWCGTSLCQARTAADVVSRRYYREGEVVPAGGTLLYYGSDHLGSVRDVLAAQNGSKVASYDYDPYGNIIAATGRVNTDFRYAGMFFHPQSGLYLTNYRAYDPRTGRWISRDPLEESEGPNLYSYVGGSPVVNKDPFGLYSPGTYGDSASCPAEETDIIPPPNACGLFDRATRLDELSLHQGYHVYKEKRHGQKWSAECAYKDGKLVDKGPGRGSANLYPDWTWDHFFNDPGGPANKDDHMSYDPNGLTPPEPPGNNYGQPGSCGSPDCLLYMK